MYIIHICRMKKTLLASTIYPDTFTTSFNLATFWFLFQLHSCFIAKIWWYEKKKKLTPTTKVVEAHLPPTFVSRVT